MVSFKLKLVLYFLLLSLLPLLAAFAGFSALTERSEIRLADAHLQSSLRAAISGYEVELDAAEDRAAELARQPALQQALAAGDRKRIVALLRGRSNLRATSANGVSVGKTVKDAARRDVSVIDARGGEIGTISSFVPLDRTLLRRIRLESRVEAEHRLVFVLGSRVVTGSDGLSGTLELRGARTSTVSLGGERYRVLAAARGETPGARLVVLTPQHRIEAAQRDAELRVLLALALALLFVAAVAYVQGRTVVATIRQLVDAARGIASGRLGERVPVRGRDELALLGRTFNTMAEQLQTRLAELDSERKRLRDATTRFGEALAASHDIDQLLRVIVETAVDATQATGGALVGAKGEVVEFGVPSAGRQRFELPLVGGQTTYGRLLLSGDAFSIQDVETASILADHAVVALENARLHQIVERQALLDGLTGLANRRQAEDALGAELARAERFGSPLGVVLADLDDFKQVNDRHGHATGDTVLREFAKVLRGSVREIDLCARWGGEEFLLLLPGTDADGAAHVAERVRKALARTSIFTSETVPLHVTSSFGVAAYPLESSAEDLVAAADTALYAAKRRGKNTVVTARAPAGPVQIRQGSRSIR